jgi:hypothetical protein
MEKVMFFDATVDIECLTGTLPRKMCMVRKVSIIFIESQHMSDY